jgi:membrane carboxypeptidase/penicillin-binding protein
VLNVLSGVGRAGLAVVQSSPGAARERQRHVLDQLVANGYLTRAQAQAAYTAPLPSVSRSS